MARYSDTLSSEDHKQYTTFWAGFTGQPHEKEELLEKFYADPNISFEVKEAITFKAFRFRPATSWGYRYLSGDALRLLTQVKPLPLSLAINAAKNPNFTWEIVEHMFTVNTLVTSRVKNRFIQYAPDSLLNENFIFNLVNIIPQAKLDPEVVVNRIRPLLGFDESIPTSWVLQAVRNK